MKKKYLYVVEWFDRLSMRRKMKILRNGTLVPFIILIIWMISLMNRFNVMYSGIISNMAAATEFNSDFRSQLDYKMYRIVAGAVTFDEVKPYEDIDQARVILKKLKEKATTTSSAERVETILRLLKQLEKSMKSIENGEAVPGRKDSAEILDKDIYQLTELVDEKMGDYIRYEAEHASQMKEYLEKQMVNTIQLCVAVIAVVTVLILILTRHISESINRPVQELCESAKEVAQGNFDIQVNVHPMEEMQVLGTSFNTMVKKTGCLVEKVKTEQMHLRKMELKLLQAMINPHFLYNTLETIMWLAEDEQNQQVVSMVDQLAIFFRTTLSKGQDFITLWEEESHVRSYLEIQRFRYNDILEYEVEMAPEIHSFYILKICLQPIVENALYHGIKNKRKKGRLTVKGWREGNCLHFCVSDTGQGMKPEELKELTEKINGDYSFDARNGFGLLNVNERLRLTYGEGCKLHIESEYGIGTTVSFRIPLIRQQAGKSEGELM